MVERVVTESAQIPGVQTAIAIVRMLTESWRKDATETSDPGGRRWEMTQTGERIERHLQQHLEHLLTAAPPANDDGWRPISEAPKDGTSFVAMDGDVRRFVRWNDRSTDYRYNDNLDDGYWEWFDHNDGGWCNPLIWCPLPAPPASEGA